MGIDVARNLKSSDISNITVSNRTESKAIEIAQELEINHLSFNNVLSSIKNYDVIISGLSVKDPFININNFKENHVGALKYFIDLGIPRTIDNDLENIPGVGLFNIDQIQAKTTETVQKRIDSTKHI